MTKIKICGITSVEDALLAAKCGAWAVGFIFYKKSPRYIGPYKAKKIIDALPPFVTPVGVFVDTREGAVKDILNFCGIGTAQFHGSETPEYCQRFAKQYTVTKALRIGDHFDEKEAAAFKVRALLLDTYVAGQPGGTGQIFDWSVARKLKSLGMPIIVSGGLTESNVAEAIEAVQPYAVDVSSGVEDPGAPGRKNERAVRSFCERVQLLV